MASSLRCIRSNYQSSLDPSGSSTARSLEADMHAYVGLLASSANTSPLSLQPRGWLLTRAVDLVGVLAIQGSFWRASRPHHCAYVWLGVGESVSHVFGHRLRNLRRHTFRSHSSLLAEHLLSWISTAIAPWIKGAPSVDTEELEGLRRPLTSTSTALPRAAHKP